MVLFGINLFTTLGWGWDIGRDEGNIYTLKIQGIWVTGGHRGVLRTQCKERSGHEMLLGK